MVRPSLHVHPRQGIHHPRDPGLPGARLRPHRLLRGRHRRTARLDGAAHRHRGRAAAAPAHAGHTNAADAGPAVAIATAARTREMRRLRRTKVVATLGPASGNAEMIAKLFEAGADVFRINMSHTPHDRMREL